MVKKLFLLLIMISLLANWLGKGFAQAKQGMTKWEYYKYLKQKYENRPPAKLAKPSGFNDRKYGRFDVGKIGLEINNANTLGYSREMLTFEYPIGSSITYQWCQTLIVAGILNGQKCVSNGGLGIFQEANENHFEPLPGYDSGIGENGLAMSNKPNSWAAVWPNDVGPIGSIGFPGVKDDGEVAGDAEGIWMAVDDDKDSKQMTPLHVKSYGRGIQFSSILAEDFIVFKYFITNTGKDTIKDCYVGVYTEMDCPEEGNNEWEDDYAKFISVDEDPVLGNFLYIWDGDDKAAGYVEKGVAWQGLKMLETPLGPDGRQLGLTTLAIATYTDFYALPTQADIYNELTQGIEKIHNVTPHPGDWTQTPNTYGPDVAAILASGPFDLAPGQTVTFTFANIFGINKADLLANTALCQTVYDLKYKTAKAPTQPNVRAVAGDRQVTLFWDPDPSESSVDEFTGNNAFEGYKIYRSTDRGRTWGEKITNSVGALVGYVPIAQYDLENNIKGVSQLDPYFFLGEDTGLLHKFVDRNLKNGVEYWYAVCAYDHEDQWGILPVPPLENSRLSVAHFPGDNTVSVIPQKKPAGYQAPTLFAEKRGTTTVDLLWEIMAEDLVIDNRYTITFSEAAGPVRKTFSVFDSLRNQTVISNCPNLHGEEDTPTFDGIKLMIIDEEKVAFDAVRSGWFTATNETSRCNWKIIATSGNPLPYDYEVRFNAIGDTAFFPANMIFPFQIWNVTLNQQADVANFTKSPTDTTPEMKNSWTSGDVLQLRERIDGQSKLTWAITLSRNPVMIDTVINGVKTTIVDPKWVDIPPQMGDIARVFTLKPVTKNDLFILRTKKANTSGATQRDLDQITVIPNPYVVTSVYETVPWIKELQFHNLPEKCEIRIFTISGELVQILHHEPGSQGYRGPAVEAWNLWSYNEQEVAFGVYFFRVKAEGIGEKIGKFAIIK
ncbi:MAG: hypothetical protein ONB31_06215 [candidate division KSB1 bacterium]|nr:hypothetical protein [candidate division KSB1 bacterium]MDZ7336181.1 hypothetical protein [candidate division KSB1 bacterium]MDZ7358158.1 hypothetical protein [candidate division KSB1 bacterium]MDZ7401990.1 hypothetical protein [candidate division KSB1 bacterium]